MDKRTKLSIRGLTREPLFKVPLDKKGKKFGYKKLHLASKAQLRRKLGKLK